MIAKVYTVKPGTRMSENDAQLVGVELQKIADGKVVTPSQIVKAAKAKESPLHKFFEWNDKVAANKYREWQARYIMCTVMVKEEDKEVRAFQSVSVVSESNLKNKQNEGGYVHIDVTKSNPVFCKQVIGEAKRNLSGWKEKYQTYKDVFEFNQVFSKVFDAIDEIDMDEEPSI